VPARQNYRSVRGVTVTRPRYRPIIDVIAEARERGFDLEERVLGDAWVWGWRRDALCIEYPHVGWFPERRPCGSIVRQASDSDLRSRGG